MLFSQKLKKAVVPLLSICMLTACSPHYTEKFLSDPDINLLGEDSSEFPDINRVHIYSVNGGQTQPLLATNKDSKLKIGVNNIVIHYTYKKGNDPIYEAFIPVVLNLQTQTIYYAKAKAGYPYASAWIEDHNNKKATGVVTVPFMNQQPNAPQTFATKPYSFIPYNLNVAQTVNGVPVVMMPQVAPYDLGTQATGTLGETAANGYVTGAPASSVAGNAPLTGFATGVPFNGATGNAIPSGYVTPVTGVAGNVIPSGYVATPAANGLTGYTVPSAYVAAPAANGATGAAIPTGYVEQVPASGVVGNVPNGTVAYPSANGKLQ